MFTLPLAGFTFDTLLTLFQRTVLNPLPTGALLLAALYTARGREIAARRPKLFSWLKVLAGLGIYRKVNGFLDGAVTNNWSNDTYDWNKEIVVVTGGSDGIGALAVQMLAQKGVTVVVLDIQPLQYTATPNVHYFHCDLASPTAIAETAEAVRKHVGHPTVLINNAGFARGKTILETSESDLKLTFAINSLAHYYLAQAFLPHMVETNHGMVVTVASLAAYVTAPQLVDYSASKAAALSFHEGLAAELKTVYKAPKVRTVAICQGYTRTALFEGFHAGDGFLQYALDPATVAGAIVDSVLAGKSAHVILPRANANLMGLKGWALWLQVGLRGRQRKLMREWRGRQVAQPTEEAEKKEKEEKEEPKGIEESLFEEVKA
ncbi:NAD(P)-binding protein [Trichodelitschia bisporula]|uniref:Short-chain dehydrogenase/reductase 3 n=1 Tax=Trichodelitschia bisporula TaxID=703511 RepID=A0A6G1I2P7_9PEZI|nr:NAD(P)-binding protein [Trichodelitschia bisporula]